MSLTNTLIGNPVITTNFHRKYVVDLPNIVAGGAFTTVDIVLEEFPARSVHMYSNIKHTTAVAGTSFSASTARLKWVTSAASPISTSLGAGALDVFAAVGVLDGTNSITSVTPVAGDTEATTKLVMTVTSTGGNLSAATAGTIEAVALIETVGT